MNLKKTIRLSAAMLAALALPLSGTEFPSPTLSGDKGAAVKAPQIREITGPEGTRGFRVEAVADGVYQGVTCGFAAPVDLSKYAGMEFYFRSNIADRMGIALRFFYVGQHSIFRSAATTSREWRKITLLFDLENWKASTGDQVRFTSTSRLKIWPYASLNKTGRFFEIAGLRLLSRDSRSGNREIRPAGIRYLAAPSAGVKAQDALFDGNLVQNQIWGIYKDDPDLVFDLGDSYALDKMEVHSFSAPSHNFSELEVSCGFDAARTVPVGVIRNGETGSEKRPLVFTFTPGERPAVGRFVRLRGRRPRSDFEVALSEVRFFGHAPDQEEIRRAAAENYQIGPPMPERGTADYVLLRNKDWQLWISRKNGVVNGVFYHDKLLVERFVPEYTLQTRKTDTHADGYTDRVIAVREDAENSGVTVTSENPKLPGVRIERRWKLDGNALFEKVTVVNRSMKERKFLRLATGTVLEQKFRDPGFYELPGNAAAAGMVRIPARDLRVENAISNTPSVAFENGETGQTLLHTRMRFNGRFTYLDTASEEENLVCFRANGWKLASATVVPADAPRQSFENRFSVTNGGIYRSYCEYINLPEAAAYRAENIRPKWLRDIRAVISLGWDGRYPEAEARLLANYREAFSPRGFLVDGMRLDLDGLWGDLPTSGRVVSLFHEYKDAQEVRDRIRHTRNLDPRFKLGLYTWFWSAFPWSTPVKNHPEWFITRLRNGGAASWFPGVNVNHLRFFGIRDSREEAADQIEKFINYYEQDIWYIDGGKSGTYAKDWTTMRIDDPCGQNDFYRDVRRRIQKNNPDRIVFFNHAQNPQGDLGFLESFGGALTSDWRKGAILMWKFKMYSIRDPLHQAVYIYWLPGIDGAFHNYLAGIGIMPSYSSRSFTARDLPYIAARYEIRQAGLADAGVRPDWRLDPAETLECMALRQGANGWIYMNSHADAPEKREVSFRLAPLGMTDPEKSLHVWRCRIRNAKQFPGTFGEQQIAADYRKCSWRAERAATLEYLGTRPWTETYRTSLDFQPGEAQMLLFSQIPAAVLSIDGEPSHYYLAGQPGLELKMDGERLLVANENRECEIGLIVPREREVSSVTLDGKDSPFRIRRENGMRFAVLTVPAGRHAVAWRTRARTPDAAASDLRVELHGRRLQVSVSPENAPVEIEFAGRTVLDRTGPFTLELPDTASDGSYSVRSGALRREFQIRKLSRPFKVRPLLVSEPVAEKQAAFRKKIGNIEFLSLATNASTRSGLAHADPDKRMLTAGTPNAVQNHFNFSAAGFEMKVRRFLRLRFHNRMLPASRFGYSLSNHFIRSGNVNCFGGLMIDFGTPGGYTARSAAGMGMQKEKRTGARPSWGRNARPDRIYAINDLIHSTTLETLECWLDLQSLGAPPDWDGRIWLALAFEHLAPNRTMSVEVLESASELPRGAAAVKPTALGELSQPKVFPIAKCAFPPDWQAIPELGRLTGAPGRPVPAETIVKAVYDNRNLYLHYDCREVPGRILMTEGGRRQQPWFGDGIEFFVQRNNAPDRILHVIIDAAGHVHSEDSALNPTPGTRKKDLNSCPASFKVTPKPPGWITEVTLPWKAIGSPGGAPEKPLAFNMMRNRLENGKIEYFSLVPGGKYFTGTAFRLHCR